MTIRESLRFTYNNVSSDAMGLYNINLQSGMLEEPFMPNKKILEEKIRGRNVPYFIGIEYESLEFTLNFAFKDVFDTNKLREVARWLSPGFYAPMVFESKPTHVYYALCVNDGQLIHNALKQGYVSLTFRCNAPWAYTPVYQTQWYDYSSNDVNGTMYDIENVGDRPTKPVIEIEMVGGTTFSIENTSDGGKKIVFTGLSPTEKLTIDCEQKDIQSSVALVYRYNNMTSDSEFIRLVEGFNYLLIKGNIKLRLKYMSPLYG